MKKLELAILQFAFAFLVALHHTIYSKGEINNNNNLILRDVTSNLSFTTSVCLSLSASATCLCSELISSDLSCNVL